VRYALIDSEGIVTNVVEWDGVEPWVVTDDEGNMIAGGWAPPQGETAVPLLDETAARIGEPLGQS